MSVELVQIQICFVVNVVVIVVDVVLRRIFLTNALIPEGSPTYWRKQLNQNGFWF